MARVLNISEAGVLALHTMMLLAGSGGGRLSAKAMARTMKASEAHLAKVLQRLARAGFVKSIRGPRGGFVVNERFWKATLLDVYEAMEGKMEEEDCLLPGKICRGGCVMGHLFTEINRKVRDRFSRWKIEDLKKNGSARGKLSQR